MITTMSRVKNAVPILTAATTAGLIALGGVANADSHWSGKPDSHTDSHTISATQGPAALTALPRTGRGGASVHQNSDDTHVAAQGIGPIMYLTKPIRIRATAGPRGRVVGWSRRGESVRWFLSKYGPRIRCGGGSTDIWVYNRNNRTSKLGWSAACFFTVRD